MRRDTLRAFPRVGARRAGGAQDAPLAGLAVGARNSALAVALHAARNRGGVDRPAGDVRVRAVDCSGPMGGLGRRRHLRRSVFHLTRAGIAQTPRFVFTSLQLMRQFSRQPVVPASGGGGTVPVTANLFAQWIGDNFASGSWTDSSGNGRTASGGGNATLVTGALNTHSIVRFNGSSNNLSVATTHAASDYTVIIAVKPASAPTTGAYFFDTQTGRLISAQSGNGSAQVGYYDGAWHQSASSTTGAWQVLSFVLAAAGAAVYRNGSSIATGTYSQKAISSPLIIGSAYDSAGAFLNADIAEFLIYDAALSGGSRSSVESYLQTKYGI